MLVRLDAFGCNSTRCADGIAAAQEGKRLVVIGSSFISMELVVAVSSRKLASIDVVGQEEYPFESVLGKQVGSGLMKVRASSTLGARADELGIRCSSTRARA